MLQKAFMQGSGGQRWDDLGGGGAFLDETNCMRAKDAWGFELMQLFPSVGFDVEAGGTEIRTDCSVTCGVGRSRM